jgi:putative addiction module killer protein
MLVVRETDEFSEWLADLRNGQARVRILRCLDRLAAGNPGDVKPVGEGVSELRIDFGPGYRVYFVQRGAVLVLLLCGGEKKTQDRDIRQAKLLAGNWEDWIH